MARRKCSNLLGTHAVQLCILGHMPGAAGRSPAHTPRRQLWAASAPATGPLTRCPQAPCRPAHTPPGRMSGRPGRSRPPPGLPGMLQCSSGPLVADCMRRRGSAPRLHGVLWLQPSQHSTCPTRLKARHTMALSQAICPATTESASCMVWKTLEEHDCFQRHAAAECLPPRDYDLHLHCPAVAVCTYLQKLKRILMQETRHQ